MLLLRPKLTSFKQQLYNYKEITIENASPGDVLEDGSIVVKKENGLALLAGPKSVENVCQWSKDFTGAFETLQDNGFNPSQWFIPTREHLNLAYQNPKVREHFTNDYHWSSTGISVACAGFQSFFDGNPGAAAKSNAFYVRPFRCVTY